MLLGTVFPLNYTQSQRNKTLKEDGLLLLAQEEKEKSDRNILHHSAKALSNTPAPALQGIKSGL